MSKRSEQQLDAMLAFDGESRGARDPYDDPEHAGILGGLDEMSELVRGYLETETDAAGEHLDRLWARVEDGIASSAAGASSVAADGAPARRPAREGQGQGQGQGGWAQAVWAFLVGHRGHVVTGLAGACAAVAIMIGIGSGSSSAVRPLNRAVASPSTARVATKAPIQVVPVKAVATPPEVEHLEVYQGSGTIVTVPGDDGEPSSSVIWLTPEDTQATMEGPI